MRNDATRTTSTSTQPGSLNSNLLPDPNQAATINVMTPIGLVSLAITRLADLFPLILLAACGALLASPLAVWFCRRVGLMDVPGSAPHKTHASPTPLAGGLVLACAVGFAYVLLQPAVDRQVAGILLGGGIMLVWGVLDDRFSLPPYQKLAGQILATLVLVVFSVQVRITRFAWLDLAITALWIIGLSNAFNFVDSMDGLALGLGAIASAFFMLVTIDSAQPVLAALAAAMLGAAVGAFFFSAAPARMFLGDAGAQLLGFLLAAVGIAYSPGRALLPQGVSWFTPILVLGVPIFDMTLVVVSRLRRRLPVHRAGHDHTYHRLLRLGLDSTRAVVAMQIVAILLGLVAFIALDATVLVANLVFAAIVLVGVAGVVALEVLPSMREA
jgi:UDP-GlcNAc:undecaprenyl-phosphate GlcNAc-1-phosphate transferase